jgi:hypothetical protein
MRRRRASCCIPTDGRGLFRISCTRDRKSNRCSWFKKVQWRERCCFKSPIGVARGRRRPAGPPWAGRSSDHSQRPDGGCHRGLRERNRARRRAMRQSRRWCFSSEQLIDSLRSQASDPHHMGLVITGFPSIGRLHRQDSQRREARRCYSRATHNLNSSSISRPPGHLKSHAGPPLDGLLTGVLRTMTQGALRRP